MRLFDKFLLACTNQRIPMPRSWQSSLGLDLDDKKQVHAETGSEIAGYRFQQDETIQRGYVNREVRSLELDTEARYLISLYLNALREHKGVDFTPYFSAGEITYQFPYYTTRVNIIRGKKYSIYGNTLRPTEVRIYCEANNVDIKTFIFSTLSLTNHKMIDTEKEFEEFLNKPEQPKKEEFIVDGNYNEEDYNKAVAKYEEDLAGYDKRLNEESAKDEYFILEIKSFVPVVVIQGEYEKSSSVAVANHKAELKSYVDEKPRLFPSAGLQQLDYSNKLMPLLTDMTITKESPQEERELVGSAYYGETFEEKVKCNTKGIYDVDEYIGGKFLW